MSTLTTRDAVNLYYKDWGPRDGRPVVLIHGWPLSADSWDHAALALASEGFRAIAYDRRGFGRSDQPWGGYDYDHLADDTADVINHLDLRHVTLVGFSMGGGEVARYLTRHGSDRIAQAALVSSVVPYMLKTDDNPDGVPQDTFDEMTEGMKKDRTTFFKDFFRDFYGVGALKHPVSDEYLHYTRHVAMTAGLRPTLACAEAFATTDFRPDLNSFTVPTLIIHGAKDQTVPIDTSGRPAADGIPGATLIEYDDAPHGLFATHQDRFIGDLLDFVNNRPARDGVQPGVGTDAARVEAAAI